MQIIIDICNILFYPQLEKLLNKQSLSTINVILLSFQITFVNDWCEDYLTSNEVSCHLFI